MGRKRLLKHLTWLMFFIFIMSMLDATFYWASLFWWFDMIMHTSGGLWVGLFFFYAITWLYPTISTKKLFWYSLLLMLGIGIGWEVYEAYLDSIVTYTYFTGDSLSDIFFDTVGFVIAFAYYTKVIAPMGINRLKS